MGNHPRQVGPELTAPGTDEARRWLWRVAAVWNASHSSAHREEIGQSSRQVLGRPQQALRHASASSAPPIWGERALEPRRASAVGSKRKLDVMPLGQHEQVAARSIGDGAMPQQAEARSLHQR